MSRRIEVFRMSGAGNLFSVIDNSQNKFNDVQLIELAVKLCTMNQNNDFVAEGLLAISKSDDYDFEVKYLNPDGSTGMMCGNGGRCAVDFAVNKLGLGNLSSINRFLMAGNTYFGELSEDGIRLTLPPPVLVQQDKTILIDGKSIKGTYVNVSSDHFVINFDSLNDFDVKFDDENINNFSPNIRFHKDFGLAGVNVNIFRKAGDVIYLKTFERGVEKITGACGTGAVSTAIHLILNSDKNLPKQIMPPSSIPVFVDFKFDYSGKIKQIFLSGHSEIIKRDFVNI